MSYLIFLDKMMSEKATSMSPQWGDGYCVPITPGRQKETLGAIAIQSVYSIL
jgi:hypothetical protein